jgi:cell wall-associated NlpC family hydrolase
MGNVLTRAAALVAGLAVIASSTVGSELPADAATACATAFTKYAQIGEGSKGDQAKGMECLLSEAGFTTTVDGSFSSDDAAALARFRTSIHLKALPIAGRRAWSALLSQGTTPKLATGDKGEDVVRLQQSLRSAGFTKVTDSATVDRATVAAVKATQQLRHLDATGVADRAVWTALQTGRVNAANIKAPAKRPVVKRRVAKKPKKYHATSSRGVKALRYARHQLGERYRYGGAGPNAWDCSGLTMKAWRSAGVHLPHNARAQFHRGHKVSRSHLKKGDLVFFYSGIRHVGIYAGHGKIIHASRPGHPVAYIKIKYMPYKGARRP